MCPISAHLDANFKFPNKEYGSKVIYTPLVMEGIGLDFTKKMSGFNVCPIAKPLITPTFNKTF